MRPQLWAAETLTIAQETQSGMYQPQWCRSRGCGGGVLPVLYYLDVEEPQWSRSCGCRDADG